MREASAVSSYVEEVPPLNGKAGPSADSEGSREATERQASEGSTEKPHPIFQAPRFSQEGP